MDCKEKQEKIEYYAGNNMRHLRKLCDPIIAKKNLPEMFHDDLYSDAQKVLLETVDSYKEETGVPFDKYLQSNISKSFWEWSRNSRRLKRCNYMYGSDGKPLRDKNGEQIIITDISLDMPNEEGTDISEKIASEFDLFNEVIGDDIQNVNENLAQYYHSLGPKEKKITSLIAAGYTSDEVKSNLGLSDREYHKLLADMRSYDKKKLIIRSTNCKDIEEEKIVQPCITTSEKTKNTSYSIEAICKKLNKHRLRDDHPLQRKSGQWNLITKSELISDILQGKSFTQIIISEELKMNVVMYWLIDGKQRCTNIDDFLHDGFAISKKVQVYNLEYQTDKLDENGNVVLNEDGFPIPEMKTFDIRGKKFSQLPEELQDKFKEYQVPVMLNMNCTKKDIAYDIARFNRCRPMTVSQNGWTGIDEVFAEYIDNILKMEFFKSDCNKSNYTDTNDKNGALRRMIVESIMLSYYTDDVNRDFRKMCEYLSENASESIFIDFYTLMERISSITTEDTSEIFNTKNSPIWFALFNEFSSYNASDEKFGEFIIEFTNTLHSKKIDNVSFDEIDENKHTKNISGIMAKLNHLKKLLSDYLGNKTDIKENLSDFEFVKENVSDDVNEEDFEFYKDMVDDSVKCDTPLYEKCTPALIALMAIACQEEKDTEFESWAGKYAKDNITFSPSQKVNFMYMKNDFEKYCQSVV
jgi:hypothetical protein